MKKIILTLALFVGSLSFANTTAEELKQIDNATIVETSYNNYDANKYKLSLDDDKVCASGTAINLDTGEVGWYVYDCDSGVLLIVFP